jgi:hypothetical protein
MNDLPEVVERFAERIETLERRVYALEHPYDATGSLAAPAFTAAKSAEAQPADAPAAKSGGMFSVAGKAMLGIAGAYLLRAVAESGTVPMLAIAAIAIVYAALWLVWAARAADGEWLASATYACTSALILAPMLWELTLNFKVLSAPAAAAVVAGYVVLGAALGWRRKLVHIFWVVGIAGTQIALALSIATHDLGPFITALLLMCALAEFAASRGRALGVRPLVAAAADLGAWALIFIYSSPQNTRVDYRVLGSPALVALPCALFAIYGASVTGRTVLLRQRITVFETGQAMAAFLLAAASVLFFGGSAGTIALGVVCLLVAAASYAAAWGLFVDSPDQRNFKVYATWGAALCLAGGFLCLPPLGLAICLGTAAVIAAWLGVRLKRLTLEFHAMFYLTAAVVASGLLEYAARALALAFPAFPGWGVGVVSLCAILCYAVEKAQPDQSWKAQFLQSATASLAVAATAAFLVSGAMALAAMAVHPEAHHLAFIRSLILCALALALAYAGSRWRRMELTQIGYALLVLVAAKLLFEDLRVGHLGFIAASIFLFALTLIAVPRLARNGNRA